MIRTCEHDRCDETVVSEVVHLGEGQHEGEVPHSHTRELQLTFYDEKCECYEHHHHEHCGQHLVSRSKPSER